MKIHTLKTLDVFFQAILAGVKSFEIRKNDRQFYVLDIVELVEVRSDGTLTGEVLHRRIIYMTDYCQIPGYVVLQLSQYPTATMASMDGMIYPQKGE